MTKNEIIQAFPNLGNDSSFRISSKEDINYNCIAWAGLQQNEFWWPEVIPYHLDGVKYIWPYNVEHSEELKYFIELFQHLGFNEISDNIINEHPKFRKIALFIEYDPIISDISNCQCTHAARQLKNGLWASKLGRKNDIEHSDPFDLEGPNYGKLAIILKKEL